MMEPLDDALVQDGMAALGIEEPVDPMQQQLPSEEEPFDYESEYWLMNASYSTEFGEEVITRFNNHIDLWNSSNIGNAIWKAYRAFHALSSTLNDQPMVSMYTSGDGDELLNMDVAHYRELVNRQISLITNQRPTVDPQARTASSEAMRQVPMARNLLDYDLQFSPLQDKLVEQLEVSKVCGSAFLVSGWNPNTGLDSRGWFTTRVLAPWEMAHERCRDYDTECTWWVFRAYESRWEWVARYAKDDPKKAKAIFDVDASAELFATSFLEYSDSDIEMRTQDRLPVLYVIAKPTVACPDGRFAIVTAGGLVLFDGPHPYGNDVPISRLCSSTFIGTSIPFADSWTMLAPCDAYNGIMSAIMSRVDMGAVPNVVLPVGYNFTSNDVSGANFIEVPHTGGKVELVDLLALRPELLGMLEYLKGDLGDLSGINAAVRGAGDGASSGSHAALMQSLAVQFNSRDERAFALNMEKVCTHRLRIFQIMASEELTISVCGSDHAWTAAKFKGEDVKDILKVTVKVANPMQKSVAGKLEMARDLLQNGDITPADYMRVAETGILEDLFAGPNTHINLVKSENDMMQKGEKPVALWTDQHDLHIREHRELLTSDIRYDQQLCEMVNAHIMEHSDLMEQMSRESPDKLIALGMEPLPTSFQVGEQARQMEMTMMTGMPPAPAPTPQGPAPQRQPNTEPRKGGKPPGPAPKPPGQEPSQAAPKDPKPSNDPSQGAPRA
jgi:hypothetical protein